MKQTANKAVPFLLLLLVLAYVVKQPAQAAHTFSTVWDWLGHAGTAFGASSTPSDHEGLHLMSTHAEYLSLFDTIVDHLTTFDLPAELAATSVHRETTGHSATIQLACRCLPDLASALLAWADTLTGVTADAFRPASGQSVHLSITGRLADGSPITVYGGLSHTVQVFGPYLEPGDHQNIPLGLLREWADLAGVREAA